ncbi:MAG TPA: amino acid permease [Kofleriaceae bacterium]|nr:amino acid permease [Kofleriaceae bacterium]
MPSPLFARKSFAMLQEEVRGADRLHRVLGPYSLTALGVGAIIGTGIFVLSGKAAADLAGPAVMLSFVVAGITCVFAALCYAEFAAMVPVAGSAYTYSYATMGELFAWIIGWDLILEYAVASATVAHGWSHYFQDFLRVASSDTLVWPARFGNAPFDYNLTTGDFFSTGAIIDVPAIMIAFAVTAILVKGIRESAGFNALVVTLKLGVVLLVVGVGATLVDPANWKPFAPFGYGGIGVLGKTLIGQSTAGGAPLGMMAGAATIFFAYIGFDAVSTHAEEARNPQRDVPIGIIASLIICTVLYIAVAAVLTGMIPFHLINRDAPVSNAFMQAGKPWAQFVVSLGAVAGITSVLLVMMLSQPRVFLAMARDGLLPPSFFGAIHPRFKTPWKSTIMTGLFVALLGGLLPLNILADLVNIGTLLAFLMVCAAVLIMRRTNPNVDRPFRAPGVPFTPIAGMACSLTLMLSLPGENWLRLFIWLALGFIIYFAYGRKHSVLAKLRRDEGAPPRP